MKLYYKVFIIPIIVMVVIFVANVALIESHLKSTLSQRFEQIMQTLSHFALSSAQLLPTNVSLKEKIVVFDALADQLAKKNTMRVSFFSKGGILLGDSVLSTTEILNEKGHVKREEVIAVQGRSAQEKMQTFIKRYSPSQKTDMLFLANYDPKSQYITRIALPANTYLNAVSQLRLNFIIVVLSAIAITFIFGCVFMRLIRGEVLKERDIQQTKLIAHTKEITLIQTMTTLLSRSNSIQDTSAVLQNILPQIMPSYSGAVYLNNSHEETLSEFSHWGESWSKNVSQPICWSKDKPIECIDQENKGSCHNDKCQFSSQGICINLFSDQGYIGLIHFINSESGISNNARETAENIAEQIGFSFSNLQVKENLRDQAIKDPLTGLYNRRFMLESFESYLHKARRHERNLAVLMIDLDHFKIFNDRFGHEAGDIVLRQVADQFKQNLRLEDIACRYGGEEFCIICPETNLRDGYQLAEKLRKHINSLLLTHEGRNLGQISLSIGLAISPNHADNTHDLLAQADKALYSAKARGRNCTVVAQASAQFLPQEQMQPLTT